DKAIKVLDAAKKSPGVTKEQITKANKLKNQCLASKQKLSDLNLSKEAIFAPGSGAKDSIYVTAGKAWEVTASPDWCNAWSEADVLFIEVLPNEDRAPKKGIIEVTMGKERTAYVVVNQEKRLDINCPVRIQTSPERAMITVDNNPGMLSEDFVLGEGKHRIRIEKSGFERKDTTIVLGLAEAEGVSYKFKLKPLFATVSVNVKPAEGYSFDEYPTLDISGNEVNLRPSNIKSFDVDQELSYYSLYEGDLIPLRPGQYILKVTAKGFVPEKKNITAVDGMNQVVEFVMDPICGRLAVSDEENAAGAVVFVDEKEVGTVPISGITLQTGRHTLRVVKPGFVTDADSYEVDVEEDKITEYKVSMQQYSEYLFNSEPAYCKVYMDGEYAGTTPIKLIVREGEHNFRFEKNGFFPIVKNIKPALDGEVHTMDIVMENSYPLLVSADKDSLSVEISKGRGKEKVVYASGVKTPASVLIPLSSSPYNLELFQYDTKRVYKGRFKFSDEAHNEVNVLSWEDGNAFIAANIYVLGGGIDAKPCFDNQFNGTKVGKNFFRFGDVSLSKMKIVNGLTTSMAKAAFFFPTTSAHFEYPPIASGKYGLKYGDDKYADVGMLPAFSVVFINEEFRVGGAVLPFLDVDALATYTWYPNLAFTGVKLNHMSGHDIFFGAEASTRFQIINANIKMGLQTVINGKANIFRPGVDSQATKEDQWIHLDYNMPMQFVITAGFTLGGRTSRGQNILRVF
ncbi:MAG: PEGA domain-containing protein, partial [Bacteroidales bacterium]|nr:PEGA domain-containing protein [Bacteroidales bacterium]